MPITLLDIFLLAVMLISGVLAMIRGFMREVLSIAAWLGAAVVALYGYPRVLPMAKQYLNSDIVAAVATVAGLFLGTLVIITIITVRISDKILDSRIGALDRTLGFLFGLARGLLIVAVAFIFFDWLAPVKQPGWISNAKSRIVLKGTGEWLESLLPEDLDKYISGVIKKRPKGDDEAAPESAPQQRRSELQGYQGAERAGLRSMIESKVSR
jgi:membrane protein required for colicin V production